MYIEDQRDWVFRSYNRTRWCKYGKGKSLRSDRLANTKKCEECADVFDIGKLL